MIQSFDHTSFTVADIEGAVAFWRDVMGFAVADLSSREGDWLVALTQDAGRGRQGRAWQSATGNFYGSTLVGLTTGDVPPTTLSLAAANNCPSIA